MVGQDLSPKNDHNRILVVTIDENPAKMYKNIGISIKDNCQQYLIFNFKKNYV